MFDVIPHDPAGSGPIPPGLQDMERVGWVVRSAHSEPSSKLPKLFVISDHIKNTPPRFQ